MRLWLGSPRPLGATWDGAGINFAVFSEHATRLELCLFDDTQATAERERLPLVGRTDHVWHGYLPGAAPGLVYGYRAYGPWAPDEGQRFNPAKVLLDPYAIAIARPARPHPSLLPAAPDGDGPPDAVDSAAVARSEERRVGKECRSRWS